MRTILSECRLVLPFVMKKKKKNWVYHAIVVYKKPIKLPPCIKIARYFHGERQKCFELLKFWHTSVFRLGVNSPLPHSKTLQIFFFVSDFVKSQVLQRTAFKMTKNLLCQLNIYIESLVYLRDGFVNILYNRAKISVYSHIFSWSVVLQFLQINHKTCYIVVW